VYTVDGFHWCIGGEIMCYVTKPAAVRCVRTLLIFFLIYYDDFVYLGGDQSKCASEGP